MSNNNLNALARQTKYLELKMAERNAARKAVNVRGNPLKTRRNRRHGGAEENAGAGATARYLEQLMEQRKRNANMAKLAGKSRKNRKASRKNTRRNNW